MDSNDNLMLLSICAEGMAIENAMKIEQKQQHNELPTISNDDLTSVLQLENISIQDNTTIPSVDNVFLDFDNDIPSTDVLEVPKTELIYTEEEDPQVHLQSCIQNAIQNALT